MAEKEGSTLLAAPVLQKAGVGETFVNLIKAMVGAGFLATPYATKNVGYLGAVIIVPGVALVVELGIRLLLSTKRELKMRGYRDQELTYAGIGRVLLGQLGFVMVMATICIAQFGACIAYVIFVEETLFEFYSGIPKWCYALMMLGVQCALCQIRQVRNLQYTSVMGNVLALVIIISIYGWNLHELGVSGNKADQPWDFNIRHFPRCIGITTFALEGITVVLTLESAMREPKFFMIVTDTTMVGLGILLLTFGEIGYMVYGSDTKDMITKNFPDNIFSHVIMGTIMLNLVTTFPVQMFPVTEIADKEILGGSEGEPPSEFAKTMMRLVCVAICVAVGIIVPDFGAVLGVMGGFCFIFLGILFPVLFYLILFEETLTTMRFWGLIFVAVVGSATSMLVTVNAIIDLIQGA